MPDADLYGAVSLGSPAEVLDGPAGAVLNKRCDDGGGIANYFLAFLTPAAAITSLNEYYLIQRTAAGCIVGSWGR
jgi:hypothetical protein